MLYTTHRCRNKAVGIIPQMKEVDLKEGKGKWGVRELARILHRSPSHICRVLSGERKPSAEIRRKLARRGIDLVVSR